MNPRNAHFLSPFWKNLSFNSLSEQEAKRKFFHKPAILFIPLMLVVGLALYGCSQEEKLTASECASLQKNFVVPHDTNVVWCYYYWINDDISKEGVTKDMEAMKAFGIGGVLIGNINPELTDGRVPLLSDEWWDITVHAVIEGHRLGIDVGFFNSPGWSQSGGPWINHEKAMRHKVYTETQVTGPMTTRLVLEKPADEFQDTYILAFRSIEAENHKLTHKNARIHSVPPVANPHYWLDGVLSTETPFDLSNKSYTIHINADAAIQARSIIIHPATPNLMCEIELQAKVDGEFVKISSFLVDRRNKHHNVGPVTHGPVAIAIPETTSDEFKLLVNLQSGSAPKAGFSEIIITEARVFESYIEKTLGKMHSTPLPDFDSYLWEAQPEVERTDLKIEEVVDISEYMDGHGVLNWNVPEGKWTILRMGLTPTGTTNSPAAPQGTGYEVDKMNADLASFHFDQFMGEIIRRVPKESLPALKYCIADSYEMGSQNWTDGFEERFEKKYGYNPVKYLPVYSGRIVESVEASERFLWDIRRAVADDVAYKYVGGLRKAANKHGLKLWLENYGHWGFPSEFLMYGGQSDIIGGEYWNEGTLGNIECKAASSAGNIYGKPFVSAESWTAGQKAFLRHPALLKKRGDWSLTEGINHHVLHVYIHQPDDIRVPGVNAWFGTEFNRHNTWFDQGKIWVDYLRRAQHLLQQGLHAADVCYFIGEDAPKMSGLADPPLPSGYAYDYINAEVISEKLFVKDGRLTLPHGINYGLMVLPQNNSMRPELLEKIEALVKDGAAILGPRPVKSPSLQGFPESDLRVKEIASRMWGDEPYTDGKLIRRYGKGWIMDGLDMQEALDVLGISKDLDLRAEVPVLWVHRTKPGLDVYFLTHQGDETIHFEPSFKVSGKIPQLWDATTGEIRLLSEYTEKDGRTIIPMQMEALQSWFVVFTEQVNASVTKPYQTNFPEAQILQNIEGNWTIDFDNKDIGPAEPVEVAQLFDWTKSSDERIAFYSGTAKYTTHFSIDKLPAGGRFFINLGDVGVMARVRLNGVEIGGVWMAPYRIGAGDALAEGDNKLEVEVVNTWRNQLIRDATLPAADRYTWVMVSDAKADEPLQASGLKGPVTLEWKK
ncbi:MAG: hypothetical protein JJU28_12040 [Cyclobacteriaceae bacterium]|nr:hypothetical protein [Cyclobacteriaceae bacterium]